MRAIQGEWDLTVIDEAHHIKWHPEESSPEYEVGQWYLPKVQKELCF